MAIFGFILIGQVPEAILSSKHGISVTRALDVSQGQDFPSDDIPNEFFRYDADISHKPSEGDFWAVLNGDNLYPSQKFDFERSVVIFNL